MELNALDAHPQFPGDLLLADPFDPAHRKDLPGPFRKGLQGVLRDGPDFFGKQGGKVNDT